MGKTQKTEQSDPPNYLVQAEVGKLYKDIRLQQVQDKTMQLYPLDGEDKTLGCTCCSLST